ncbi:MAG: hypothetical protein RI958_1032 [Actinomycetota bacterium]
MNDVRGLRVGRSALLSVRRGVVALTVAVLVVSACGSDDTSEPGASGDVGSSVVVAGALENAVATGGVCRDWPAGTTVVPCAVDAMGPGGGRVFYDAGSVQPWGRFLEVAPQNWNGTLVECPKSLLGGSWCGTSDKNSIPRRTSDVGLGLGRYPICSPDSKWWNRGAYENIHFWGDAATTGFAVGDGRWNTTVLLNTLECTTEQPNAFNVATAYRGGGFDDWYLPSDGELFALCNYPGRNAIGGFIGDAETFKYASSSTRQRNYGSWTTNMMRGVGMDPDRNGNCTTIAWDRSNTGEMSFAVRAIRAFS